VFLGADQYGVPLEVGCIELPDGNLLVIHAMKIRDRYLEDLDWEMRCRSL
jgi:hypothetical protein